MPSVNLVGVAMQSISSLLSGFQSLSQNFSQLAQVNNSVVGGLGNSTVPSVTSPDFSSLLTQIQGEIPQLLPDASPSGSSGSNSTSTSASQALTSPTSGLGASVSTPLISPAITPGASLIQTPSVIPALSSQSIQGTGTSTAPTATFGDAVVTDSLQYLNVPYVYGGTSPSTGFDCSGLVQRVFADEGMALPRTAAEQATMGTPVSLSQAQPGDLVFYGSPADHVGIYIGNGMMINAPNTGQTVSITQVGTPTQIRHIAAPKSYAVSASPTEAQVSQATGTPGALEPLFAQATAAYGLPPGLLEAVAKVESNFNPSAVSPVGAIGLMQIMPQTASGLNINPSDPAQAINGAAQLLSQKMSAFGGSVPLAVAAYNAGDGAVQTYQGIPPYPETQNYVQSVMSYIGGN